MPAGIDDLEFEAQEDLLRRIHHQCDRLVVLQESTAAVGIDAIFGIDQVAMLRHEPVDAVCRTTLFVGGQSQDQVARRTEIPLLHAQECGHQHSVVALGVLGAASVEESALLDEFERVDTPVAAQRFDDVQVSDKEDRFRRTCTAQAHYDISFSRLRPQHLHIRLGIPGLAETRGHGYGGARVVACRIRCVDLDEFLEDIPGQRLVRGLCKCSGGGEQQEYFEHKPIFH
jgi:hypothetical protein